MRSDLPNQSHVRFISGVICKSKVLTFERMLFRATRGNMLFNQAPAEYEIMDPASNEMVIFFRFLFSFSCLFVVSVITLLMDFCLVFYGYQK